MVDVAEEYDGKTMVGDVMSIDGLGKKNKQKKNLSREGDFSGVDCQQETWKKREITTGNQVIAHHGVTYPSSSCVSYSSGSETSRESNDSHGDDPPGPRRSVKNVLSFSLAAFRWRSALVSFGGFVGVLPFPAHRRGGGGGGRVGLPCAGGSRELDAMALPSSGPGATGMPL